MFTTTQKLNKLLKDANIGGRSAAKTYKQKLELCEMHGLLKEPAELPLDILRKVFEIIIEKGIEKALDVKSANNLFKTLSSLSATCKTFREILHNEHKCWEQILLAFATNSNEHSRDAQNAYNFAMSHQRDLSHRRALELVSGTGCECCGCNRTRKVYWPFQKRWCRKCLERNTISDYRLVNDCGVERRIFSNLPFVEAELYSRHIGTYTLRFYLIDQVVAAGGVNNLDDFKDQWQTQKALEEAARLEKEAIEIAERLEKEAIERAARLEKEAIERAAKLEKYEKIKEAYKNEMPTEKFETSKTFQNLVELSFKDATKNMAKNVSKIIQELSMKTLRVQVKRWMKDEMLTLKYNEHFCWKNAEEAVIKFSSHKGNEGIKKTKTWFQDHVWPSVSPAFIEQANIRKIKEEEKNKHIVAIVVGKNQFKCPECNKNKVFGCIGLSQHAMDMHNRRVLYPENS